MCIRDRDSTALKQGRHVDPHALLGPHPLAGEPGLSIVRALLPEAESPCLLPTDQPQLLYPLQWVPGDQLFETVVVAEPTALRYQLSVTEPVSYTHLDVYKRQIQQVRFIPAHPQKEELLPKNCVDG